MYFPTLKINSVLSVSGCVTSYSLQWILKINSISVLVPPAFSSLFYLFIFVFSNPRGAEVIFFCSKMLRNCRTLFWAHSEAVGGLDYRIFRLRYFFFISLMYFSSPQLKYANISSHWLKMKKKGF